MLINFINSYLFLFFFITFGLNCFSVNEEFYISIIVLIFLIVVFIFVNNILLKILNSYFNNEQVFLKIGQNLLKTLKLHNNYFLLEFPFQIYLNILYQEFLYFALNNYFIKKKTEFFSIILYIYNLYLIKFYYFEFKRYYLVTLTARRFKIQQASCNYYYSLIFVSENYNQENKFFQFFFDKYSYKFLLKVDNKLNDFLLYLLLYPMEVYEQLKIVQKIFFVMNVKNQRNNLVQKSFEFLYKNLKLLVLLYSSQNKKNLFIIPKYLYFLMFYNIYDIQSYLFIDTIVNKQKKFDLKMTDLVLKNNENTIIKYFIFNKINNNDNSGSVNENFFIYFSIDFIDYKCPTSLSFPQYVLDKTNNIKNSMLFPINDPYISIQLNYFSDFLIVNKQTVFELYYQFDVVDPAVKYYRQSIVIDNILNKINDEQSKKDLVKFNACRRTMRCIVVIKLDINKNIIDTEGNSISYIYQSRQDKNGNLVKGQQFDEANCQKKIDKININEISFEGN